MSVLWPDRSSDEDPCAGSRAVSKRAVLAAGVGIVTGCLDDAETPPTASTPEPAESTPEPTESTPEPAEATPPAEGTPTPADPAQRIRNRAGVQSGETVGVRHDSIGVRDDATLSPSSPLTIGSRGDAEELADRGAGTAADPYVVESRSIVAEGDAGTGIAVDGADGYHVRISNCEITGFPDAAIATRGTVPLSVTGCRLVGGSGGTGIEKRGRGAVAVESTVFDGGRDGVLVHRGVVSARDCRWTDDTGSFDRDGLALSADVSVAASVDLRHCSFTAPSIRNAVTCAGGGRQSVRIENSLVRNCYRGWYATPTADVSGSVVRHCRFASTDRQHVNLDGAGSASDVEVAHSTFDDNGAGYRLVVFFQTSGEAVRDSRVHHCQFTKTTGERTASNEALESFNGRNIEFDHNWVTECPEDAFEHVAPITGCSVHHSVADDAVGQIVDFFSAASAPNVTDRTVDDTESRIHHIYGNCEDFGVIITDCSGFEVEHIQVTAGKYGVTLDHRKAPEPGYPDNVHLRAPLPTDDDVGFSSAINIDEGCGDDITIEGIGPETTVRDGRTAADE